MINTNPSGITRRKFIAAVPAVLSAPLLAAAVNNDHQELALNGGKPVRATTLSGYGYPGAQFYDDQEQTEVRQAVESRSLNRWYGPHTPQKVAKFEQELSKFMGVKYVLGITSGTAALHCALTALGVGPGDEVILPAWTWYSCYNTILVTGALPVFAEVDESFNMDPEDLEKRITPQTKAVMVVHLYGAPANMDAIMAVARRHNLKVLEDSAQTVGGQYKGKHTGTIGDIGIFSFQINKMITAGEGGAVLTNDPLLFERAVRFHDLGLLRSPTQDLLSKHEEESPGLAPGTNYRMNEMTGGVMRAQLRKLQTIVDMHRRNGRYVKERVRNLPGIKMRTSHDPEGEVDITVCLLLPDKQLRDKFVAAMAAEKVPMGRPGGTVPLPPLPYIKNKVVWCPTWPSFNSPRGREIQYGEECCPRTMGIFDRAVSLTVGAKYSQNDLNDMVAAITKVHKALLS